MGLQDLKNTHGILTDSQVRTVSREARRRDDVEGSEKRSGEVIPTGLSLSKSEEWNPAILGSYTKYDAVHGNICRDISYFFPLNRDYILTLPNEQLQLLGNVVIDLRGNAANVLLFVNTQLPYIAVQIFAVRSVPCLPRRHFLFAVC